MTALAAALALVGLAASLAAWDAARRALGVLTARQRARQAEADARARKDWLASVEERDAKVEARLRAVEARLNDAGIAAATRGVRR